MFEGILPIYKQRGITSHDVVFKARKILKMKKIGHAGTLDPEVDGVLLLLLGGATKRDGLRKKLQGRSMFRY